MDLGLDDKVALVTGAWRGTGRGIASVLAEEGARVWLHGFDAALAEREAAALRAQGGEVNAVAGDITDDAGAASVCEAVLHDGGRVDVLVNNYGVAEGPGWLDGTTADWITSYEKNVLAGVRLVRGLVPGMRERGFGRVIFVGTVGSLRPGARTPHYYAAKATLPNLTVGLAKELAGTGITVNTVSPGILATDEVRERFRRTAAKRGWTGDDAELERRAVAEFMANPSGRAGRVEEVGALVAFLASRHAGYINGANLRIDGGAADAAV
jgi:3-oxoacyl-[acyl-carrier protein] reductase